MEVKLNEEVVVGLDDDDEVDVIQTYIKIIPNKLSVAYDTVAIVDPADSTKTKNVAQTFFEADEPVEIRKDYAVISGLLKVAYESSSDTPVDVFESSGKLTKRVHELKIPSLQRPSLLLVAEYMNHCAGQDVKTLPESPIRSCEMKNIIEDQWIAEFLDKLTMNQLFGILEASECLDVTSLIEIGCACVASRLKGKSLEEIDKELGITDDEKME